MVETARERNASAGTKIGENRDYFVKHPRLFSIRIFDVGLVPEPLPVAVDPGPDH